MHIVRSKMHVVCAEFHEQFLRERQAKDGLLAFDHAPPSDAESMCQPNLGFCVPYTAMVAVSSARYKVVFLADVSGVGNRGLVSRSQLLLFGPQVWIISLESTRAWRDLRQRWDSPNKKVSQVWI